MGEALYEKSGEYTLPIGLTFQRKRIHIFQFLLIFDHPYLKKIITLFLLAMLLGLQGEKLSPRPLILFV